MTSSRGLPDTHCSLAPGVSVAQRSQRKLARDHQALMAGKVVPVLSPGQRVRIPESCLQNKHSGNGNKPSQ